MKFGCSSQILSAVRGQKKIIKVANASGKKIPEYMKVIYIIPEDRNRSAELDLISDIENSLGNQKRAQRQKVFVKFPEDIDDLEKLKQKFLISEKLEMLIIRKM